MVTLLIQFTVGSFKSFRDQTTFSMVAAPLRSDPPHLDTDNVIPVNKNLSLLRSAAVYGANASGKSNLGIALEFIERTSLAGRYGATPYLGDITRLPLADAASQEKSETEKTAEMVHAG